MRTFSPLLCLAALLAAPLASASVTYQVKNRRIEPRQTLAQALHDAALPTPRWRPSSPRWRACSTSASRARAISSGWCCATGVLDFFDYRQSAVDEWQVRRDGEKYVGSKRTIEVEKHVELVSLEISTSLYEAALAAGEDPGIGVVLADVFAWDIDFYRDTRKGDRARALVEKFVSKGRVLRYGEVLAAAYEGGLVGHQAGVPLPAAEGAGQLLPGRRLERAENLPQEPAEVRARDERLRLAHSPDAQVPEEPQRRGLRRADWHPGVGGGGRHGDEGWATRARAATPSACGTPTASRRATCTCRSTAPACARARG